MSNNYFFNTKIFLVYKKQKNFIITTNFLQKHIIYTNNYKEYDIILLNNIKYKNQLELINSNSNFENYIRYNSINGLIYKIDKNSKVLFSLNFLYIKKYLNEYIELFPKEIKNILRIIFLNKDTENIKNLYSIYGISYLLSISGFHINFLVNKIKKIMFYFSLNYIIQNQIIFIFLTLILINFYNFTILRIFLLFIIKYLNQEYELRFNKLSIISLVFFISILINPLVIHKIDFQISFLVLLFYNLGIDNRKNKNLYKISLYNNIVLLLVLLPYFINFNNGINLFIILFSIILSLLLKKTIIPLIYLSFIFYPISYIFNHSVLGFNIILNNLSIYNINIYFPLFNAYTMFIYYISLIIILSDYKNFKKYILLTLLIFNIIIIRFFNIFNIIYSFNENYNFSFLINTSFNKEIISINPGKNQLEFIEKNNFKISYLFISKYNLDFEVLEKISNLKINYIYSNIKIENKNIQNLNNEHRINKFIIRFFKDNKYSLDFSDIDYEISYSNINIFVSDKFNLKNYNYFNNMYKKYYTYLFIKKYNENNYKYHKFYKNKIEMYKDNNFYKLYLIKNISFWYNFKYNIYLP